MGRYYNGDIEGKFWFGVQSSDDADFFGSEGTQPDQLEYYFDEDNLPDIKKGIATCLEELGHMKEMLDLFFEHQNGYNDAMLEETFNIEKEDIQPILEWYARLRLGKEILECVESQRDCSFTAEC
ncbi:hypothetical protein CMI37_11070 [Candidatus Pacearchaeota archaeon]|jgi:hypothetical protein|nr:hypothetical protein [Candidatus Pacearchaeota archaeon]|tara:strand:+ start:625 stop:999 length:375 start_codon:yes stop_codon:yes gene_type:complete